MSDDKRKPKDENDIAAGFDLPGGEPTPPPEGTQAPGTLEGFDLPEDSAVPPPFVSAVGEPAGIEPHVRHEEEKPESVMGKVIALVAIPVVAVIVFFVMRHQRQQPWLEYQADCTATAEAFLKGMSDGTEDSVPAAYNLLYRDVRARMDVESVEGGYRQATEGIGKFKTLGEVGWTRGSGDEASKSFDATAQFESGALPVRFRFARVTSGGKTEVKISEYKLGAK